MSISIQQFLLSEGSKNSRLLKKSILLSRRSDEREKVWFDGWNENLNEFKNSGYKYEALIPKFVRPNNPIRLNQEYVLPEDKNFELNFINVYRSWFLEKYFSEIILFFSVVILFFSEMIPSVLIFSFFSNSLNTFDL